jgi:sulfate adenylyltransferase subunit 1
MDLVAYSQEVFESIKKSFIALSEQLPNKQQQIMIIPISSLYGENITKKSEKMNWYDGDPLLEIIETLPVKKLRVDLPFRMPVQYVIRPRNEAHHDFRGYAGKISSGEVREGDELVILPSGRVTRVSKIYKFDKELKAAGASESITLTVADDVDISRGDFLSKKEEAPVLLSNFQAHICWLNGQAMNLNKTYLLRHGTQLVKAKIPAISYIQDTATLDKIESATELKMNQIACVSIKTAKPIPADRYDENTANGSFILVDEHTNSTVAVGFIC